MQRIVDVVQSVFEDVRRDATRMEAAVASRDMLVAELRDELTATKHAVQEQRRVLAELRAKLDERDRRCDDLEARLATSQDDLRNMSKVGQLVAHERENARLRAEVQRLRDLLDRANE